MSLNLLPLTGQTLDETRDQIKQNFDTLDILFTASFGSTGYQKFPNGLLIKWGTGSTVAGVNNGDATITTAAPNYASMLQVFLVVSDGASGPVDENIRLRSLETGGNANAFAVNGSEMDGATAASVDFRWITIGLAA